MNYFEKVTRLLMHGAYDSQIDPTFHFGNICTIQIWT